MAKRFKRRRNGSGSVYKLSGNRRKPYVASVCIGTNAETGKAIQKPIGYFETYEQAENALVLHRLNDNTIFTTKEIKEMPKAMQDTVINFNEHVPTFREVWKDVFERDVKKLSKSSQSQYKTGFNNWKELHDYNVNDLDYKSMQVVLDKEIEKGAKQSKLTIMKVVITKVIQRAVKTGLMKREQDYTSYLESKTNDLSSIKRSPFSIDEIKTLFKTNTFASKVVLCLIYTGMRPVEFFSLIKEDVYLNEVSTDTGEDESISYFIGGVKTESGKNRVIPIHPKIYPFIIEFLELNKLYLAFDNANARTMQTFRDEMFKPLMQKHNMSHNLYDTRHTFSSLAKLYKMDEFARQRIMGHKSGNITDDVYTHTYKSMLYNEVLKLDFC